MRRGRGGGGRNINLSIELPERGEKSFVMTRGVEEEESDEILPLLRRRAPWGCAGLHTIFPLNLQLHLGYVRRCPGE